MQDSTPEPGVIRFDSVLQLVSGDREVARRLLDTFIEDTERRLCMVQAAVYPPESWQTLAFHANAIKGAAVSLCAEEIAAAARGLEYAARQQDCDAAHAWLARTDRALRELRELTRRKFVA